jgi:Cytochrome C'
MYMNARRLAAGLALALGLALVGSDGGRASDVPRPISGTMVLVRIEPDELTKYLHRVIQDELKAPAPDERAILKVRATAMLIASQAQNGRGGRDVWQRTALRDNALKVQKALAEGQVDVARKQAAALLDMNGLSGDTRRVPLKDLMELDEVERLMKLRRVGGLGFRLPAVAGSPDGIELKLIAMTSRAPSPAELDAQAAELVRAAMVTAAMADLLDFYAPDKKVGNKDPKDWKANTRAMRAGAEELETAARGKDSKGVGAAAKKLFASCTECHNVFRD